MHKARLLAWFIGSALFASLACSPAITQAATRTLGRNAFKVAWKTADAQGRIVHVGMSTTIPAGNDFNPADFTGAYFDFRERAGKTVQLSLEKASFSGAFHSDYYTHTGTVENAMRDIWVNAVNVKTSGSIYDYVFVTLSSPSPYIETDILGVALNNNK